MTALLAPILQEFFTAHLVTQRAVSAATIRAYRDTWKLFLAFLSERENVPAHKLETNLVDATQVIVFLDHLENDRGNSVATRNLRLAAIKATMAFQATKAPELLDTIARIHTIPVMKHPKPEVTFLTYGETQALLDAITADTWTGRRDRVMFTLAVQTGLRLSEITDLCLASVHLGAAPHVACTGKGRKNRTTPLTSTTASLLKVYFQERSTRPGQAFFRIRAVSRFPPTPFSEGSPSTWSRPRPSARTSPTSTSPCIPCVTPPRCVSSRPASMPPSSLCGSATNHKQRQAFTSMPTSPSNAKLSNAHASLIPALASTSPPTPCSHGCSVCDYADESSPGTTPPDTTRRRSA
jgi:site-specific recombinase XerD